MAHEKTTLTCKNAGQVAEAARQWVVSYEGKKAVEAGLQKAQDVTARFREAQRVDPDILHKPITLSSPS